MKDAPIVVIGTSRGGLQALRDILGALPSDFAAPILVAMHIGAYDSELPALLASACALPVRHAVDDETLQPGTVLIAPPDKHLMIDSGKIRLIRGAKENYSRPAIDPLFRSAALSHRAQVIGMVLTGDLDDGTVGLQAIKACGGVALVQDPADAIAPSMPSSALRHVNIDGCLSLPRLCERLVMLVRQSGATLRKSLEPNPIMAMENQISLNAGMAHMGDLDRLVPRSSLTCPECHGALWEMGQRPLRYRCHTGHTFTELSMRASQDTSIEELLWSAVRALHEKQALMIRHQEVFDGTGRTEAAVEYAQIAQTAAAHAHSLVALIESLHVHGMKQSAE